MAGAGAGAAAGLAAAGGAGAADGGAAGPSAGHGSSVKPMLYFSKPRLRSLDLGGAGGGGAESMAPVQVVLPDGRSALGLSLSSRRHRQQHMPAVRDMMVVTSAPERHAVDVLQVRKLTAWLAVGLVANAVVTVLLFAASTVDASKVSEQGDRPFPEAFTEIAGDRSAREITELVASLCIIGIGLLGVCMHSGALLSLFTTTVCVNFCVCIAALPYFMYSVRFVLDFVLAVIAVKLRHKISLSWVVSGVAQH